MSERVPALDRLVWLTAWGLLFLGSLGGMTYLVWRMTRGSVDGTTLVLFAGSCIVLSLGAHLSAKKLKRGPARAFLLRSGAAVVDAVVGGFIELVLIGGFGIAARALWKLFSAAY